MCPNDADRITNSVDPDQTAPLGAVWSRTALFAKDLSVWKLRIIMVVLFYLALWWPHQRKREFIALLIIYLSYSTTKPIKWSVRPAKTQISLGILPLWSESLPFAWRKLVLIYPLTLIRLGGCPGSSESSLGTHFILLVLSCCGSYFFTLLGVREGLWSLIAALPRDLFIVHVLFEHC